MKLQRGTAVATFCGYALLSVILTYPLAIHLRTAITDYGDPLLNAWIMAWETHWLTSGQLSGFFDANIFHPYEGTLAYSELLLTQSIVTLPLQLVSGDPILSYNVLVLLAITTSAFASFLLATYLTGQPLAGMIAGVVFAYCPFMFDHLSHVQVLSAGGIPMAFLFLHRYLETRETSKLALFALFYLLQVFANGYYALYLTLFAGLLLLHDIASQNRWADRRMWFQLSLFAVVVMIVAGPVLFPYISTHREMGFVRSIGSQATLTSYLATSPRNVLYGDLTAPFQKPEAKLFPGASALALAMLGIFVNFRRRRSHEPGETPHTAGSKQQTVKQHAVLKAFDLGWLFFLGVMMAILLTGGFTFSLLGLTVSVYSLANPVLWFTALLLGKFLVRTRWLAGQQGLILGTRWSMFLDILIIIDIGYIFAMSVADLTAFGVRASLDTENAIRIAVALLSYGLVVRYFFRNAGTVSQGLLPNFQPPIGFYLSMLLLAFLFSFGSDGPYMLLYHYVPGFNGMRSAARIGVIVMLAIATFAAYGTSFLVRHTHGTRKYALAVGLVMVCCIEFASVPVRSEPVPKDDDVLEVYHWLSSVDGQFAVVEYPFRPMGRPEGLRLYYSTYHWKDLVNGYSGYFPPLFIELRRLSLEFPSDTTMWVLEAIGVRYIILDSVLYADGWPRVRRALASYSDRLQFIRRLKGTYIYELVGTDEDLLKALDPLEYGETISLRSVTANVNEDLTQFVADDDLVSRWHGGPQTPDQEVLIDLGAPTPIGALIIKQGTYLRDYPRNLVIETSIDSTVWHEIWSGSTEGNELLARVMNHRETPLVFPAQGNTARWIRLRQVGADPVFYWTISELSVVAPATE